MTDTYFNGNMRRPLSIPGQYERKAARAVSNTNPKFKIWFLNNTRNVLKTVQELSGKSNIKIRDILFYINTSQQALYKFFFLNLLLKLQFYKNSVYNWKDLNPSKFRKFISLISKLVTKSKFHIKLNSLKIWALVYFPIELLKNQIP